MFFQHAADAARGQSAAEAVQKQRSTFGFGRFFIDLADVEPLLKRLGRETLLIVYPNEDHSIDTPKYVKHRFEQYLSWFNKYLKDEGR